MSADLQLQQQQSKSSSLLPAEEVRSASYARNWWLLFVIGTINNMTFGIVMSAAKSLSEEMGAKENFGLVGWANIGLALFVNLGIGFLARLKVPYWLRVGFNTLCLVTGLLLIGFGSSFALILPGIMLTGLSSVFGDLVFVGFMRFFEASLTGAFISGTGMAGLGGSLLYLGLHRGLNLPNQTIFRVLLVLPVVYYPLFFLLRPPKEITYDVKNRALKSYRRSWVFCRYLAVCLGLIFFLEFQCVGKWSRDSNNLPKGGDYSWSICASYEILAFSYQVGVVLSRSSLPLLRRVQWLRVGHLAFLQTLLYCFWLLQSRLQFLGCVWVQVPCMVAVGLCGGAGYVLTMYRLHSNGAIGSEEKEECVFIIGFVVTLFLSCNNVLTYTLDNTVWPPRDNSGCAVPAASK